MLDRLLDAYQAIGLVRSVRQHMGWHPTQPLLRYTPRSDQLADPAWRRGLALLRHRGLVCEIEICVPTALFCGPGCGMPRAAIRSPRDGLANRPYQRGPSHLEARS
jgi:hypothetical protein